MQGGNFSQNGPYQANTSATMADKYRTNTSVTMGNKYLAATLPPGQYEEKTLVKLAIIMGMNFQRDSDTYGVDTPTTMSNKYEAKTSAPMGI